MQQVSPTHLFITVQNAQRSRMKNLLKTLSIALVLGWSDLANANLIVNGDFSSGDFSAWNLFTTPSGSLGPAAGANTVTLFDVSGGGASQAARFQVGGFSGSAGGGISQTILLSGSDLDISLDIAALDSTPNNGSNASWGLFELLLDGTVVDSFDFDSPPCCDVVRNSLAYSGAPGAGNHEIAIRMTRSYQNGNNVGDTPFQYIDNVIATGSSVQPAPAPATLALFGLGLIGLGWSRRRQA